MTMPMVHLVDDEAAVRDALGFLLQSHGLATAAYADAPAFLAALAAGPCAAACCWTCAWSPCRACSCTTS
jgi:FixJ family two-component response regulator